MCYTGSTHACICLRETNQNLFADFARDVRALLAYVHTYTHFAHTFNQETASNHNLPFACNDLMNLEICKNTISCCRQCGLITFGYRCVSVKYFISQVLKSNLNSSYTLGCQEGEHFPLFYLNISHVI